MIQKLSRTALEVLTDDGKNYDKEHGLRRKIVDENEFHADDTLVQDFDDGRDSKRPSSSSKTKPINSDKGQYRKMMKFKATTEQTHLDFTKVMMSMNGKKGRTSSDILIEGHKLILEALEAGVELKSIYYSDGKQLKFLHDKKAELEERGSQFIKVDEREVKMFSSVVTSTGVIGIFKKPDLQQLRKSQILEVANVIPLTLIADNIRDPGNLGTLIRTAAAVGVEKLICTAGCVDIWEPKVIRAGTGGHFRLDLVQSQNWTEIEDCLTSSGLASHLFMADPATPLVRDEEPEKVTAANYTSVDFRNQGKAALIIGSESRGVTKEGRLFATKFGATKIWIPLANKVESLNSSVAAAIIMYEFRRQLKL
ncbi:rRNA methyltransferase 3, mitochondrial [Halotydeus destructor]|nr:rRNA methyltransferase 3, mitochondrial [Halotydeus destructor]